MPADHDAISHDVARVLMGLFGDAVVFDLTDPRLDRLAAGKRAGPEALGPNWVASSANGPDLLHFELRRERVGGVGQHLLVDLASRSMELRNSTAGVSGAIIIETIYRDRVGQVVKHRLELR